LLIFWIGVAERARENNQTIISKYAYTTDVNPIMIHDTIYLSN
jgi:hypothetical protein